MNDLTSNALDQLLTDWAQASVPATLSAEVMARRAMRVAMISQPKPEAGFSRRWGRLALASGGLAAAAAAVLALLPSTPTIPADIAQPVPVAQEFPSDSKVFTMLFSVTPDEEDYI
jgi:hypothetical protein